MIFNIPALTLAIKAHNSQSRKNGDPFVLHPIAVATLVSDYANSSNVINAALLHDVKEDSPYDKLKKKARCFSGGMNFCN